MSRVAAAMVALGLVAASPASGWASGLEVRLGAFFPRAQSNLFDDDSELYTVDKDDWRGLYGGAEFSFDLASRVEMGISLDGYSRTIDTVYRDFVRENGTEIPQSLRLTIVPLGVSLRLLPAGRRAAVSPYLTIGGDVFFYKYEEFGEFIDFFSDDFDISSDSFVSDGAIFGGHAAAGLRVPVGDDFAVTGEVRYQFAPRRRMNDDFRNNDIDLSGASATLGFRLRF
jgi:hypothetical protein